jgi:hypothetical protein
VSWFILFVGVVVVCLVAALILGLAGGGSVGGMGGDTRSLSHEPLPDEAIVDSDFDDLVFDVGLRGYRMSQVDGVVDRLRRELREKDEEIAVLRAAPDPAAPHDRESTPSAAPEAPDGTAPPS